MRYLTIPILLVSALMFGCAARARKQVGTAGTLAELREVPPDVEEAKVDQSLDQAMNYYRRFLEETPETAMSPEAMRRLADLQIEKQFGIQGGDGKPQVAAAPETAQAPVEPKSARPDPATPFAAAGPRESDREFEERTDRRNGNPGGKTVRHPACGRLCRTHRHTRGDRPL